MNPQPRKFPLTPRDERRAKGNPAAQQPAEPTAREMPCPMCGHPMSDLKGGKDTICPVCGFKDSCCF